jgi:folate-binding protein YgfZ
MDPSPLLDRPGAVAAAGVDAGVAQHYGDPFREQRDLAAGRSVVDLSHFGVVTVTGPDRAKLLHALSTQDLRQLPAGGASELAVLDPHGHVEHHAWLLEDGSTVWLVTDAGRAEPLAAFLDSMLFMLDAEVADVTEQTAVLWLTGPPPAAGPDGPAVGATIVQTPDGAFALVPRADLVAFTNSLGRGLAGVGAWDALRVAAGRVRPADLDVRTIPNELGWIGTAVALDKGCYRGQETVARVHTPGRPPRRLTILSLDGSDSLLPHPGDPVLADGRQVGTVSSAVRHFESGPLALALIKRSVPVAATLSVVVSDDGRALPVPALQEPVVDPDIGLHVRPQLR